MDSTKMIVLAAVALAAIWYFLPDIFDRYLNGAIERRQKNKRVPAIDKLAQAIPSEPTAQSAQAEADKLRAELDTMKAQLSAYGAQQAQAPVSPKP